jgi:hypothetical protein
MQAQLNDRTSVGIVPRDNPEAGALMTRLGIKNANANRLFITFTCTRSLRHGDKGYMFWLGQRNGGVMLDSLDGDLPGNDTLFLRQIDESWFLFRSMAD